jgi:hypothetical protein
MFSTSADPGYVQYGPESCRPSSPKKSGSWRPLPHDHWHTSDFRGFSPPPSGGCADGGGAEPK